MISKKEIIEAHNRIEKYIHRTPIMSPEYINNHLSCNIYFKCENFQKVGAFKSRGAINADDAYMSMIENKIIPSNNPTTLADILLTSSGKSTFPIIKEYIERIFTCKEKTIVDAMKIILERMKIIIEPSSSTALAIIMENKDYFKNKKIGIILSGGNIDLNIYFDSFTN